MRWSFWLVLIGSGLIYMGFREVQLRGAAKAEPQNITCAELAENGPGDNAHVIMSDFLLADVVFVYEGRSSDGPWTKVWVPAVPLGGHYHQTLLSMLDEDGKIRGAVPKPADINIIVKTSNAPYPNDLDTLADQEAIQGVIVNKIESLESKERKLLEENYPGVDFDECWILEVDRKPATLAKVAGFGGGGVALFALGASLIVRGRAAKSQKPQSAA